jgi:hypothetical protein
VVQATLRVDPQGVSADEVGVGHDDTFGTTVGDVQMRLDGIRAAQDA